MHSPCRAGKISSRSICVRPLSLLLQIAEQVGELSMAQLTRKPVFWVRADASSDDACVHALQRRARVSLPSAFSDTLRAVFALSVLHVAQAYAGLVGSLSALIITFIALAANTAQHCVYLNGVCLDRPFGGYA